jgi:hypothetical protein
MAQRYGGKFSPSPGAPGSLAPPARRRGFRGPHPVPGMARANLMFVAPLPLLPGAFGGGSFTMVVHLCAFAALILGAWLLREGLQAEAAYNARDVARRPAFPRKFFAAEFTGIGVALATFNIDGGIVPPVIYGMIATILQLVAFGFDPMRDKVVEHQEAVDRIATERVTRVVDTGEDYLAAMAEAIASLRDRRLDERVEAFQATAREMFRAVERDPRDLSAARKYLGVYLMGARDAARKFATVYRRGRNPRDRADFIALLDDMQTHFEARTDALMANNRTDLDIEIEVLRERLQREGVRPQSPEETAHDQPDRV